MPKNAADQETFNTSCTPKEMSAGLAWMLPCLSLHTRKSEIPIMMNSAIHTGENSQFGGVKEGLFSEAYHVGIASAVKIEPMKPASWHIAMLSINRQMSGRRNFFISYPMPVIFQIPYVSSLTYNYNKYSMFVNTSKFMRCFLSDDIDIFSILYKLTHVSYIG
jgi:hypothetical protein